MAQSDDNRRTVRGMSDATYDAAVKAARRAGVPIGKWLSNAVDLAVAAEREPLDQLLPPTVSDAMSAGSGAGDLAAVTAAGAALARMADAGLPVAPAAARDVVRVMRALVREAGGLAPLRGRARPALLEHADPAHAALVNGAGTLAK